MAKLQCGVQFLLDQALLTFKQLAVKVHSSVAGAKNLQLLCFTGQCELPQRDASMQLLSCDCTRVLTLAASSDSWDCSAILCCMQNLP